MGVVLKAQHIRMERMVALKVLRSRAVQSATGVQRFQKEVRAAAKLSHPNIVTAYDADEVGGVHFLVMEYVNGHSLAEVLANRGRLEIVEAVGYVIQVARGLEYAHSEGVVHRDIKPGNLLLDKRVLEPIV
jgi:serine/threonine protein kinase